MGNPAEVQIRNLIYRYADAVDNARYDEIADIYGRATVVMGGREMTGREAADAIRDSNQLYDGVPCTHHVMTNIIIDFDETGTSAKVETKYNDYQGPPATTLQVMITGGYHDQFRSENGEWYFSRREYWVDLVGDLSKHLKPGTTSLN